MITLESFFEEENLRRKQIKAIKAVNEKRNIFLTGKAGTGKSHVVKAIKKYLGNKVVLTASTGVAATNIGGTTTHSFLRLGRMTVHPEIIIKELRKYKKEAFDSIKNTQVLLVDEISMFSSKELYFIDYVLRQVKSNELPFGGTQIILVGDLLQLPFVDRLDDRDVSGIPKAPIYNSDLWKSLKLTPIFLDEVIRQDDLVFLDHLEKIRYGEYSSAFMNVVNNQYCTESELKKLDLNALTLVSSNREVDLINFQNYEKLKGTEHTYKWFIKKGDEIAIRTCGTMDRVEKELKLKVGSKIILNYNVSIETGLVNGTTGKIVEIKNGYPIIEYIFRGESKRSEITPIDFQEHRFNPASQSLELELCVSQLPISLAYAVTVNRSQGLSLNSVIIDLGDYASTVPGQVYTAISRCRKMETLYFKRFPSRRINPKTNTHFAVDLKAIQFLNQIEQQCNQEDTIFNI